MNTKLNTTTKKQAHTSDLPVTPFAFWLYVTKQYKWYAIIATTIVLLVTTLGHAFYYLFKLIIDAAEQGDYVLAAQLGLIYPALLFVEEIMWRSSGYFGMNWALSTKQRAYHILVEYLMDHSHGYFSDRFAGSILSKINNVTNALEQLVIDTLWTHFSTVISLIVTMALLATVDVRVAWLFFGLLIAILLSNYQLAKVKRLRSLESAAASTALRGYIVDMLGNVGAVRQYVRKPHERAVLKNKVGTDRNTGQRSWVFTEIMLLVNGILLVLFVTPITVLLTNELRLQQITTGDFILVFTLITALAGTLIFIGRAFNNTARSMGEMEEGLSDLLLAHEVTDALDAKKLKTTEGAIEWNDVVFEYGPNRVFNQFGLQIKPYQRIGLVGPSGAGKTTFASLLLRQHDIQGGAISIDSQNIAEVTQDSLREAIAVVPQEPLLFHRTIKENIAYGKPSATKKEIEAVAKKAQAHDFISELSEGYDTLVGERGVKLSGGQKQRVAIARAMLKDAPILVLDEATSALDSESEVEIQKALHTLMAGKTVVAIAHRLSTLREMDRIVVLEDGQIKEDGSHDELTKAGGTYQRLWEHQAGGFLQE